MSSWSCCVVSCRSNHPLAGLFMCVGLILHTRSCQLKWWFVVVSSWSGRVVSCCLVSSLPVWLEHCLQGWLFCRTFVTSVHCLKYVSRLEFVSCRLSCYFPSVKSVFLCWFFMSLVLNQILLIKVVSCYLSHVVWCHVMSSLPVW